MVMITKCEKKGGKGEEKKKKKTIAITAAYLLPAESHLHLHQW